MKLILRSVLLILFCFHTSSCFAQVETPLNSSIEATNQSNLVYYDFTAAEEGNYNISIYGPHGEEIARPLVNAKIESGTSSKVKFDTKYWQPGSYRLVIRANKKVTGSKRFVILAKP